MVQNEDLDYFGLCSSLNATPELMSFKLYSLTKRGQAYHNPIIQPPIMKLLTTKKEREVKMEQLRPVSKLEKILFPIVVTVVVVLILPTTAPLVGMLMLGNLFRESGVVKQLTETASHPAKSLPEILIF